jgi:hypothetical protein
MMGGENRNSILRDRARNSAECASNQRFTKNKNTAVITQAVFSDLILRLLVDFGDNTSTNGAAAFADSEA